MPEEINVFKVLNLIINGLPSKLSLYCSSVKGTTVLNLIINGLPSKLRKIDFIDYQGEV